MKFKNICKPSKGFGAFDEPYDMAEIIFIGIPLKTTDFPNPGVANAPTEIREASLELETFIMPGPDIFEALSVSDLGDLDLSQDSREARNQITEVVREILGDGKVPALLGGEHTLSGFAVSVSDAPFVLYLDAHRDLRESYRGRKVSHGTVARRILDHVPPEKLIQVGVRSCSKSGEEFASKGRICTFTSEEIVEKPNEVVEDISNQVKDNPVYLSIDLDVLDPAFAPAVTTPEPGGASTLTLLKLLCELGKLNIQGFDLVEFDPSLEGGKRTGVTAARVIYELLGALARSN